MQALWMTPLSVHRTAEYVTGYINTVPIAGVRKFPHHKPWINSQA